MGTRGETERAREGDGPVNGTPARGSRLAFAGALSALMVGVFVSFGGLSYAASAGSGAVQAIKKVSTSQKLVVQHSSANDQYPTATTKTMPLRPPKQKPASSSQSTSPATATKVEQGTLPFTGLSLLGTALVSGALLALGLFLRRRERRSS
jgi:subtilisin family serine protease